MPLFSDSPLPRVPHSFAAVSRKGGVSFAEANDRASSCRHLLILLLAGFTLLPAALLAAPQAAPHPSIPHGSEVFATAGCVHCHGPAGIGGGKGPDLKNVRRRLTAAQMTHQIQDGGQSMPPFGDILTPQEITDLVAYLRSKRR